MKVAVLSEGEADEAAITILTEGVLGSEIEYTPYRSLRGRGWPSVHQNLPMIIRELHYNKRDVEALVVVVDSDNTPIHYRGHDEPGVATTSCRLCLLRRTVKDVKSSLSPVAGRAMIKTALGLAVPSIEAWYLCGVDTHVNEAAWARHLKGDERSVYTVKSLKRKAYGMDRAPQALMTSVARRAATRLVTDLDSFERLFPGGFGALASDIRSW